jgi:hypothetical protein
MKRFLLIFSFLITVCISSFGQAADLPAGYIGRVLNNAANVWQNYSFNYTPTVTGSQFVMLTFRQDPAYWYVDNVSVKAAGSSTNLMTNGNMTTGGSMIVNTATYGDIYINAPTAWGVSYQNGVYPSAAGTWMNGQWVDGAVGSYDGIYQGISMTAGVTYTISFDVMGNHTATPGTTGWQLGVYAGTCGNTGLAPTQCTLPSSTGFNSVVAPSDTYSTGCGNSCPPPPAPAGPTITGTSTTDSVNSSSSTGLPITTNNQYQFNNQTYSVIGTSTPITTTVTTTPVTITYWSDGTTTSSSGNPSTTSSINYNYNVSGPTNPPVSPYTLSNKNGVYITQVNAGSNNNVQANQSGHGNYESISVGGSNNTINAGQGYTYNTIGIASESPTISSYNVLGLTVSGNSNRVNTSQVGNSNSAIISVTGNNNNATISQTGNNNQSYNLINGNGNALGVYQTGNNMLSSVNLYGNNNTANVTQIGSGTMSAVVGLTNQGGPNNLTLIQTGNSNLNYSVQQTCANPAGCSSTIQQGH